jgi:predicted Fe-S protein YdhL (DUF1289 family)
MKSPCIRQCKLDVHKEVCEGCGRTKAEIVNWASFTDAQRDRIMLRLTVDKYWPDLDLPPINLLVVTPARWN